jgi:hypothetical protein
VCVGGVERGLADFACFADADFNEQDLVEKSVSQVIGGEVGLERLLGQLEGVVERVLDVAKLDIGASKQPIEGLFLSGDPVGFASHHAFGTAPL